MKVSFGHACIICGAGLGRRRLICSKECETARKRYTKRVWRLNNPAKFKEQQMRHNERSREYRKLRNLQPSVKEQKKESDRKRRQRYAIVLAAVRELGFDIEKLA